MWHSDTIGWVKTPNHSRYQAKTTHWDICIMSVQLQTRSKTVKAILLLPKEKLVYPFWKIQILSLRSLKTDYKWFSMIGFHANDSCKKVTEIYWKVKASSTDLVPSLHWIQKGAEVQDKCLEMADHSQYIHRALQPSWKTLKDWNFFPQHKKWSILFFYNCI